MRLFLICFWILLIATPLPGKDFPPDDLIPPSFEIFVDDKTNDNNFHTDSVVVIHELDKPSYSEITTSMPQGFVDFPIDNQKIEIQSGISQNLSTVFVGNVVSRRFYTEGIGNHTHIKLTVRAENNKPWDIIQLSTVSNPLLNITNGQNLINFDLSIDKNTPVEGIVSIIGEQKQLLGNFIKLNKCPSDFNKVLKVVRVEHHYSEGFWRITLGVSSKY